MKTFTVRELDRQPARVLDACDREGAVRVRRRGGRSYVVRPEFAAGRVESVEARARWLQEHERWLEQTYAQPVAIAQTALVDRLIGGE
jgi:hypothetical protein